MPPIIIERKPDEVTFMFPNGKTFKISPQHVTLVIGGTWYMTEENYVRQTHGGPYLHCLICKNDLGMTDHWDRDTTNNRIDNLRPATHGQNRANSGASKNNVSGFKGVGCTNTPNRWTAQININGYPVYLGRFDSPEEANAAYCKAAKLQHKEFSCGG